MKTLLNRAWREDEGVLTFEWILLITVIVIGIVGGVSAVRDGLISELGDVSGAVVHIDQSYTVITDPCTGIGTDFGFDDEIPTCFGEGLRPDDPPVDQGEVTGCP